MQDVGPADTDARSTSTFIDREAAYTNYDVLRVQEVEYVKYKHYVLIDSSQLYWFKIGFDRFAGRNTTISFTRLISHRIGDYELTGSKLYASVLCSVQKPTFCGAVRQLKSSTL